MFKNMKLSAKLLLIVILILIILTGIYFATSSLTMNSLQRSLQNEANEIIRDVIINDAKEDAKRIAEVAESVREYTGERWQENMYNIEKLRENPDIFLNYIPIIYSINVMRKRSSELNLGFDVVRKNARNKEQNEARGDDIAVFDDYYKNNGKLGKIANLSEDSKTLTLYSPIFFTQDCMVCHGTREDVVNFWGEQYRNQDPLGYAPDGSKAGDFYALFKITVDLERVQEIQKDVNQTFTEEAQRETTKGYIITAVFTVPTLILAIILMILLIRNLIKKIYTIKSNITKIANKDYTQKMQVFSKDEIGEIAEGINTLHNVLNDTLMHIKKSSKSIDSSASNLSNSVETSSEKIKAQISSFRDISEKIENQYEIVEDVDSAIDNLTKLTANITNNIHNQSANVRQTSASINSMIQSIGNITNATNKANDTSKELAQIMKENQAQFNDLIKAIQEIRLFSDQVQEVIAIISSIATKTNLLAINSSIEAAHAGETGKGFAVVSEEIRRLAENTSENVTNIEEILQNITDKIENASQIQQKSLEAMNKMKKLVHNNAEQNEIISNAMSEQTVGNREISQATATLLEITQNIVDITDEEKENLDTVNTVSKKLKDISINILTELDKQKEYNRDVSDNLSIMMENIIINKKQVKNLEKLISEFKLRKNNDNSDDERGIALAE